MLLATPVTAGLRGTWGYMQGNNRGAHRGAIGVYIGGATLES